MYGSHMKPSVTEFTENVSISRYSATKTGRTHGGACDKSIVSVLSYYLFPFEFNFKESIAYWNYLIAYKCQAQEVIII